MTWLILGLLLCWDPPPDPDVSHYRVWYAERHVDHWADCPCDGIPDNELEDCVVPPRQCPVYNEFIWFLVTEPTTTFSRPCADEPHSLCIYKHPTAVDFAGNESSSPELLWPPPVTGDCP